MSPEQARRAPPWLPPSPTPLPRPRQPPLLGGDEAPQGAPRRPAKELNCLKRGAGTQGWERLLRQGLGEHGGALPQQPSPRSNTLIQLLPQPSITADSGQ